MHVSVPQLMSRSMAPASGSFVSSSTATLASNKWCEKPSQLTDSNQPDLVLGDHQPAPVNSSTVEINDGMLLHSLQGCWHKNNLMCFAAQRKRKGSQTN